MDGLRTILNLYQRLLDALHTPTLPLTVLTRTLGVVLASYTAYDYIKWIRYAPYQPHYPWFYLFVRAVPLIYLRTSKHVAKLRTHPDTRAHLKPDELTPRRGPAPQPTPWVIPHRHIPQLTSPHYTSLIAAHLTSQASTHNLLLAPSVREAGNTSKLALYSCRPTSKADLSGKYHPYRNPLFQDDRIHYHPDDGSLHVALHPRDAAVVLENGWGLAFPLTSVWWLSRRAKIDIGTVLLFAPRDDTELATVLKIIDAGVQFELDMLRAREAASGSH